MSRVTPAAAACGGGARGAGAGPHPPVAEVGEDLQRVLEGRIHSTGSVESVAVAVDENQAEAAPEVVLIVARNREMAADEVEVMEHDLRPALGAGRGDPAADLVVERVVEEDHGAAYGRRREQVLDVALDAVGGVVAVDEDEVGVAALVSELREKGRQQLVAVAQCSCTLAGQSRCGSCSRSNEWTSSLAAAITAEAAALGGADLDRQPRLQRREDSLQRRPFAERHLPVERLEER